MTTSYFGAGAIRHESYGIECYSPYQDKDLQDVSVMDSGDLELCFGDVRRPWIQIKKNGRKRFYLQASALLCGGRHLVTLGTV